MLKYKIFSIFFWFCFVTVFSQNSQTFIIPKNNNIRIDGKIFNYEWLVSDTLTNFRQFEPYNGTPGNEITKVFVTTDANSLYIAAICQTKNTKLYNILTARDDFGQADYFGVYIDPYCSGTNAFAFFVTAAGVQVDFKIENEAKNFSWDAVWFSAVQKNDINYTIEMKIPFSAFRIPQKNNQIWKINFYRYLQEKREMNTWNYIDNSKTGEINQMGELQIVGKINPPNNLSVIPYITYYSQNNTDTEKKLKSYSFGTDLKYSLNESFTLDVMLIPDFSDVKSDDPQINLTPYEIYYNENRYFFTEGTEIFNKGNIFYSRRIGKTPTGYAKVSSQLSKNETILSNPYYTNILNAIKLSGRTNNGNGLGVLNAFTGNTFATIYDTLTDVERKIQTEAFANYNVFVFDIPLANNSYTSIANTNYLNKSNTYYSNVTAWETVFKNKKNSFSIYLLAATSNIKIDTSKIKTGFNSSFRISKTSGKFRLGYYVDIISKQYNPNDLGYLTQNNVVNNSISAAYNIYKPRGAFLMWRNSVTITQQRLYEKFNYILTTITFNSSTKLKNNLSVGTTLKITPDSVYDYFEPRAEDRFFIKVPEQSFRLWFSTNYANPLAYDFSNTLYSAGAIQRQQLGYSILNSFRVRFSNNVLFVYTNEYRTDINNFGYVGKSPTSDSIFFGKRNLIYITNTIEQSLVFTKNISLSCKIRHYWSRVIYTEYFQLSNSGYLYPLQNSYRFITNKNVNYNAFNVDLNFVWYFRPGTLFTISYRKQITSTSILSNPDYYDNFEQMYFKNPHNNSITFKLVIYLNLNLKKH